MSASPLNSSARPQVSCSIKAIVISKPRSLGVVESALRRWVSQLQQERNGLMPQSKALTSEQQKIYEPEARIARLERKKSILKGYCALDVGKVRAHALIDRLSAHEPIELLCEGSRHLARATTTIACSVVLQTPSRFVYSAG